MDYLLLGRVAKLVALLGFFLPWVTVSCSGTEIMQATGLQLMTGDIQPSEALANMGAEANANTEDPEPSPIVIAAFAALALGLLLTLVTRAKIAAGILLAGALAGMGLSYYAVESMQREMARSMNEAQNQGGAAPGSETIFSAEQQSEMAQAMSAAIKVERQEGFWLTIGAAGVAAMLGLIVLAGAGAQTTARPGPAPPG